MTEQFNEAINMVAMENEKLEIHAYGRAFEFVKTQPHKYDIYENGKLIFHCKRIAHHIMVDTLAGMNVIIISGLQVDKRSDEECCQMAADLIARCKDK